MPNRNRTRRPKKAQNNARSQASFRNAMIQATAMSSYYGAKPVTMKVAFTNTIFTTTASGAGTLGLPISFAGVSNSSNRYGQVFDEVRVLDAKVTLVPLTSSNGMTAFWWSEKALTSITLSTQSQRLVRDIANSNGAGTGYVMRWKSDGFQDLSWDPVTSPVAAAYFYMITDPAYGTPAAAVSLWNVQIELTVQLRGIASQ
jgi:hypothetical protein